MSFTDMWFAAFPPYMWILFVVAAVLCAVGFYKFVYFLSVGYGFAIIGEGVTLLVMGALNGTLNAGMVLMDVLFMLYGARLSGFLLIREFKSAAYRKTLKEATKEDEKPMPVFVKAAIWVSVSILYVMQVSPVYYYHVNGLEGVPVVVYIAAAISLFGLVLELSADLQKSAQKKVNPDMVATKGLYTIVRCPNYLGEIIFWTGVLISGVCTLQGMFQWIIAVLGWVCIVYIMFNGAQRLEKRQLARYSGNAEYEEYAAKTPIIIPFVPLYTLNKKK